VPRIRIFEEYGVLTQATDAAVEADAHGFSLRNRDAVAYRVNIGYGVLEPANSLLAQYLAGRQVTAFIGPTVDTLYGDRLRRYLGEWLDPGSWSIHRIQTGERHKTMSSVDHVCGLAKERGLDRQGVMLAVGGGIVSDIVGFAAAIYARGISYVRVNTTLVGQVDAGVGVKTGVNAYGSKNMLGAYHPPRGAVNDPGFLATLRGREIRCGMGEIVKMAVIKDGELFGAIEQSPEIFHQPVPLYLGRTREEYVMRRAMELMLRELCPNLRERELARVVDFGHTFGPAIETDSGYRVRHGESVAIDMAISSHLALRLGLLDQEACDRIVGLLAAVGLPVFDEQTCTVERMQAAMRSAWLRWSQTASGAAWRYRVR